MASLRRGWAEVWETDEPRAEPKPEPQGVGMGRSPPTAVGADLFDEDEWDDSLMSLSVDDLVLSLRSTAVLRGYGILTLGDIIRSEPADLVSLRNFGRDGFEEVRERVSAIIEMGLWEEADESRLAPIKRWLELAAMMTARYTQHALDRMHDRNISDQEVEAVLSGYHTHYHDRKGSDIYVGHPSGRRIKVVVAKGSHPPLVITVGD